MQDQTFSFDSYFNKASAELQWLHYSPERIAVELINGMQAATFTDEDFVIKGCTPKIAAS